MKKKRNINAVFHNAYTAWVILFISLVITVIAWFISTSFSKQLASDRFTSRAAEISILVEDRMEMYEQALWGGVALFNAKEEVRRRDWYNYVQTLNIQDRLPGIQGMGYAIPLNTLQKDSLVEEMKRQGFEDFAVNPEGPREEYSAILYLEPFDWRNQRAFGFDMWSNEMRRDAMQRAINEKRAATSGIITLVQETNDNVQKGFLTYLPVFENVDSLNFKKRFKGWVYAAFRAGDLMKGILGESKGIDIELFDGGNRLQDNLLFDSNSDLHLEELDDETVFEREIKLSIQGREWLLYIHSNNEFIRSNDKIVPKIIAIGGVIIDFLLFFVIFSISKNQKKAEAIAADMTIDLKEKSNSLGKRNKELRKSEEEMKIMIELMKSQNERLTNFSYIVSHNLRTHTSNITMLADIIREDSPELFEDKKFQMLSQAAENLSQTIAYLNEVASINITNEKSIVKIKLIEYVNRTLENISVNIHDVKAVVNVNIENNLEIDGIPAYVESILLNLLTNAIKYRSPERVLEINIDASKVSNGTNISVSDNGSGIDLKKHGHKVFKMYKVFHDHKDSRGIGLYIVKNQIEALGGSIGIESELNVGTTFILSFKDKK